MSEAESNLASILLRLNAGFVNIIDRFVKGKSTCSDYDMLLNLSNISRLEAVQTFEQLQSRISQSSLSLSRTQQSSRHKKRKHSKTTQNSSNHTLAQTSATRSKKASKNPWKQTYLGPANSNGWIRMKHGKIKATTSSSSAISSSVLLTRARKPTPSTTVQNHPLLPPQTTIESPPDPKPVKRLSIMSFATTSTKIGEIPEHKWISSNAGISDYYGGRPVFPVSPYVEPEKPRSRLRKIFRRDG